MMFALEKCPGYALNLGSGTGYSIKELVEIVVNNLEKKPKVVWDISKPSGDKKRLMDISKAKALGWQPKISLEQGVKEVMEWYEKNKDVANKRYNVFTNGK